MSLHEPIGLRKAGTPAEEAQRAAAIVAPETSPKPKKEKA